MKSLNKKIIICLLGIFGFTVLCLAKDADSGSAKNYNIILISINNIGTQHMGMYGYKRHTTPKIGKWAKKALVFENAFSHASWTLPVITSVFTSLYPYSHKVLDRYHGNLLDKNIKTLPQILKGQGYQTAAFTGGLDNHKMFGHMQGFQAIDNNPAFTGFEVTLPQAKQWLDKNSENKFFLFIHGYDAHPPFAPPLKFQGVFSNPKGKKINVDPQYTLRGYKNSKNQYIANYTLQESVPEELKAKKTSLKNKVPEELKTKKSSHKDLREKNIILTQDDIDYLKDLYDEKVLSVDSMVGEFLSSLKEEILENTVIIIFSEHGEMFARHGRFGRSGTVRGTLYEEVVNVPLIMKIPQQKSKRIRGLVQLIDIMPTILDLLNISPMQPLQGKSLIPLIQDNRAINEFSYAGALYNYRRPKPNLLYQFQSINESVRTLRWKLIHEVVCSKLENNTPSQVQEETFELYDCKFDRKEKNNLIKDCPRIANDLKNRLSEWNRASWEYIPSYPTTDKLPQELIDEARKHGYW